MKAVIGHFDQYFPALPAELLSTVEHVAYLAVFSGVQ